MCVCGGFLAFVVEVPLLENGVKSAVEVCARLGAACPWPAQSEERGASAKRGVSPLLFVTSSLLAVSVACAASVAVARKST